MATVTKTKITTLTASGAVVSIPIRDVPATIIDRAVALGLDEHHALTSTLQHGGPLALCSHVFDAIHRGAPLHYTRDARAELLDLVVIFRSILRTEARKAAASEEIDTAPMFDRRRKSAAR